MVSHNSLGLAWNMLCIDRRTAYQQNKIKIKMRKVIQKINLSVYIDIAIRPQFVLEKNEYNFSIEANNGEYKMVDIACQYQLAYSNLIEGNCFNVSL